MGDTFACFSAPSLAAPLLFLSPAFFVSGFFSVDAAPFFAMVRERPGQLSYLARSKWNQTGKGPARQPIIPSYSLLSQSQQPQLRSRSRGGTTEPVHKSFWMAQIGLESYGLGSISFLQPPSISPPPIRYGGQDHPNSHRRR
jgi:hypothetical protein